MESTSLYENKKKEDQKKKKKKKNWSWLLPVQKSWIHHIPPHNKPICGCLIGGSPSCPAGGSRYVVEMPASIFLAHFCKGKMGIFYPSGALGSVEYPAGELGISETRVSAFGSVH